MQSVCKVLGIEIPDWFSRLCMMFCTNRLDAFYMYKTGSRLTTIMLGMTLMRINCVLFVSLNESCMRIILLELIIK